MTTPEPIYYSRAWTCGECDKASAKLTVRHKTRGVLHVCQSCFDAMLKAGDLLPWED